jgi:hypothetical protein
LVDEGAKGFEVVVVDGVKRKRVHGQLRGGSSEKSLRDVAKELVLSFVLRSGGVIDVGLAGFFAFDEAFVGHDLQELEDRGVADGPNFADLIVKVADGGGAELPESAE